jgi:hypothetical protein
MARRIDREGILLTTLQRSYHQNLSGSAWKWAIGRLFVSLDG